MHPDRCKFKFDVKSRNAFVTFLHTYTHIKCDEISENREKGDKGQREEGERTRIAIVKRSEIEI